MPFAIVSGDEIVIARAKGKPVVALLAVYQTHPQGIMARASRGFKDVDFGVTVKDGKVSVVARPRK